MGNFLSGAFARLIYIRGGYIPAQSTNPDHLHAQGKLASNVMEDHHAF